MFANVLKHTIIRSPRRATPTLSHFSNSSTVLYRVKVKARGPLVSSTELTLPFNSHSLL